MSDQTDIAWAAGFIDGEGCIQISKPPKRVMTLKASQKLSNPLQQLKQLFGGNVYQYELICSWQVSGRMAAQTLERLLPYLTVKQSQARVFLNLQRYLDHCPPRKARHTYTTWHRGIREWYYHKLRAMKKIA